MRSQMTLSRHRMKNQKGMQTAQIRPRNKQTFDLCFLLFISDTRTYVCPTTSIVRLLKFLGRWKAALYCFYFHRKCPEHAERCLDIYNNNICPQHGRREFIKSVHNLSAIFQ